MQTIQTLSSALGWFSRLVTITVDFDHPMGVDTGEEFIIPWDSFTGVVPLIDLTSYIRGRVVLTVPDGVRVKYTSIVFAIEQYLHYLDPFVSSDLCTRELVITPSSSSSSSCWLEGTTIIHFELPLYPFQSIDDCRVTLVTQSHSGTTSTLSVRLTVRDIVTSSHTSSSGGLFIEEEVRDRPTAGSLSTSSSLQTNDGKARCRWWSSYIGENFGLRHSMTVTVKRPWYAHSPEYSTPLSFYRIITPMVPGTDGTAAPSICKYHDEEGDLDDHDADDVDDDELGVNWRPLVLSLSNFHGVCQMTLPSRWVNLDTPLLGKITFHDFTESVVSCHLLLIRAEHVQGDVKEKTLLIHQVFGKPFLHLYDMIEKGAMLSTGGSTRLDPEEEEVEGEEGEEEGEEYERTRENDEQDTSNTNTPANSSGGGNKEGGTAERVYEGLLPQHFNIPQKATNRYNMSDYGYTTREIGGDGGAGADGVSIYRPVVPRDGHCATFIIEMPLACSASTSSSGSSGSGNNNDGNGNDCMVHKHEPCNNHNHNTGSHNNKDIDQDKEASLLLQRKLCLSPSFTTTQQDGEPFYLYVEKDDDDEDEEEEEEEEEEETAVEEDEEVNSESAHAAADIESGSTTTTTEIDDINDIGGGGVDGGSVGTGSGRITGGGDDDEDVMFQQMRVAHRNNQKQLRKQRKDAMKKQQRATRSFDFLDESIAVRYYLRMVIRGEEADDLRWSTTEIVLYRSQPPCHNITSATTTSSPTTTAANSSSSQA